MNRPCKQRFIFRTGDRSPFAPDAIPKNGGMFDFDKERCALTMFLETPSELEIYNFTQARAHFGLYLHGPVVFLLSRFGCLPMCAAPYSVRLVSRDLRGLPQDYEPGKEFRLQFLLVDSATNIIEGLRVMALGPEFSQALAKAVATQMNKPCPRSEYEQAISNAYAQHPTAESMLEQALILYT